ncbi:histidine kinase [Boudabousia tangfeifanii]|uniref:histidine kinase n=1 Tax=Boudabousia tangfeifanii TaxID=1912795 RepID=A0A1D9MJ49_9ACTO|nr:PAS domain-containing sensor histidine kinase [Boudabousia tangfeifanii]AOZ72371.1 histidine kinase [Boudabousia tangfeifanii]
MQTLTEIIQENCSETLSQADLDWLHVLVADWQILSDLAPADLILWLPTVDNRFIAVAHCRPATAVTVHLDDIIGLYMPATGSTELQKTLKSGRIIRDDAPRWAGSYSVQQIYVPVVRDGRTIAVVSCETNLGASTSSTSADRWFANSAEILMHMIASGEYPYEATPSSAFNGAPRVIDGVIRLDADGLVLGISPNARSCFRRLGVASKLVGEPLVEQVSAQVMPGKNTVDEALPLVLMGRAAWRTEVESPGATISFRALPLIRRGEREGAIVLCRDVSEVRRIEREIMSKEATIREIHHRVKNNLATVSALIRLQSRRSQNPEVKQALSEAERRVSTISTVHEALSHTLEGEFDYTPLARTILTNAALLASSDQQVSVRLEGDFGKVDADRASTLSTVLAELVANSVEHGYRNYGGEITVRVSREEDFARIIVSDEGEGFDPQRKGKGLGTQIVQSLVNAELHGYVDWVANDAGGTDAVVVGQVQQKKKSKA